MNWSIRLISSLALWVLVLGLNAHGQTSRSKQAVSFRFSCASWETPKEKSFYFLPGKAKKKETKDETISRMQLVDVPEMTRSATYEYKGGNRIAFYRKKMTASGEVSLDPVASSSVPKEWKKVLFVFFPGEKPGKYRILPIRDDRKFAPYGSYQFVNLTDLNLNGLIDKQKLSVKAKGRKLVQLRGSESRSMNFGVWAQVDGKKRWFQRNTITYRPNKYLIYFFYPKVSPQGKLKVKSKGIVDFRPPPAPPEGGGAAEEVAAED